MTTPWSDTPPSEAFDIHWIRRKSTGDRFLGQPGMYQGCDDYQFGPRVLSAEDTIKMTAEVERLRVENVALRERLELANRVIANPTKVAME